MSYNDERDSIYAAAIQWPNSYLYVGENGNASQTKPPTVYPDFKSSSIQGLRIPVDFRDYSRRTQESEAHHYLRNIDTPCAVCGNRPGMCVDTCHEWRELRIRFECHGKVSLVVITEREIEQYGYGCFDNLIPFKAEYELMVAASEKKEKRPAPQPVIVKETTRRIRME